MAPFESATHLHHHHHHISTGEALAVFSLLAIERKLREKPRSERQPTPAELGLAPNNAAAFKAKLDADRARRAAEPPRVRSSAEKLFLTCAFSLGAIIVLFDLATGAIRIY